ncbi:hypothetical protein PIB30_051197 [Stylosanthes scabra]|uniref:Putative plant transposon protein domain-containing protein n=1 Tax=Stylosanthes scabra TaxID=79078 RepID=A0ABU6XI49_9FABA|nr:hypothetical protein [Stylosanthes scabra]
MADKKRKGKVVSSSSEVPRFKTLYHEAHYKSKLSARKVLPELIIQVDEDIIDPCGLQIQQRKWERFTNPIQAVGHLMVKELYANALEPNKEKRKPYTYTTMVRGIDISFAPSNIKRVLKLRKDPLPNAASYHERKANKDYRLERVLEDLCIEGADWVRHKDGRPHYLRRADLEPMTKEPPFMGVAMTRTRETGARNPRQARQEAPQQPQPPPQVQPQHQQDFPPNFYTHFDASMSQIYWRLDNQQEERVGRVLKPSTKGWTAWMTN